MTEKRRADGYRRSASRRENAHHRWLDCRRINGTKVDQHPHGIGGRHGEPHDGSQIDKVPRPVDHDPVEPRESLTVRHHHVDRVGLGTFDAPKSGRCSVRRHCSWPRRPHSGQCSLLQRGRTTPQPRDRWIQPFEITIAQRSVPGRATHAELCCHVPSDQPVMATSESIQKFKLHTRTGHPDFAKSANLLKRGCSGRDSLQTGRTNRDQNQPTGPITK